MRQSTSKDLKLLIIGLYLGFRPFLISSYFSLRFPYFGICLGFDLGQHLLVGSYFGQQAYHHVFHFRDMML
jgi:hypothetical protein